MLFLTNLVAILIVWTIFFWLYWFTPHIEKQQKKMYKWLSFVVISIIIILIPLVWSYNLIREEIKIKNNVSFYLTNIISTELDSFSISDIEVKNITKDNISLKTTVKLPENTDLSSILSKINWELSSKFWKTVEIDLEIIRVVSIISEK
jgi:Co/Zn/Cd efflux system component